MQKLLARAVKVHRRNYRTLKQVMEEKLDSKNVQLASVTKERGFRIYSDEEMSVVVERLPTN